MKHEAPVQVHALALVHVPVQLREERVIALRQVRQQQRHCVQTAQVRTVLAVEADEVRRVPRLQQRVLLVGEQRDHGPQVVGLLGLGQEHEVRRRQRALRDPLVLKRDQHRLREVLVRLAQLVVLVVAPHVHAAVLQQRRARAARRENLLHLAHVPRHHAHEVRLPAALGHAAVVHLALRAQQQRVARARSDLTHLEVDRHLHHQRRVLRRLEAQLSRGVVAATVPTPHRSPRHSHVAVHAQEQREVRARAARAHQRQVLQQARLSDGRR